ncbi:MAG: trimeric intracellular cation channel family protein [Rhodocyclaceae bacterium]|nr:trimeric intracellular cation channel family protein [Rhodocyclaceae bacterium]
MSAAADLLYAAAMAAVAVNAASAVLETEDKRMDLVGAITVGLATSLGGGTLRDVLLDRPVFWLGDINYLVCGLLSVFATFALARRVRIKPGLFVIPDAIGLALFTVVGCQIALAQGIHWLPASLLAVVTGVFGGMLRDILVNEVPLVMRPGTLYATASWLGALTLIGGLELGIGPAPSALAGGALVLLLRLAAIRYRLSLPTYRSR